jgi:ubiquinone/menaquinone biosynthesis C-methylase UbiE
VGCGNGAAAVAVADAHGLAVTGVDLDPDQVRSAREAAGGRTTARFEEADAIRLPFADESFDIVASYKTLHHVPDWERAIAEMVRVLKPNGRLIYTDLVVPRWLAAIGRRVAARQAGFVTRDALRCVVESQGLGVVRQRTSGAVLELFGRRPPGYRQCDRVGGACRRPAQFERST